MERPDARGELHRCGAKTAAAVLYVIEMRLRAASTGRRFRVCSLQGCLVGCNEAPRLVLARLAKSRGRSPGSGEPASEITGGQAGGQAEGGGSLSLSPGEFSGSGHV